MIIIAKVKKGWSIEEEISDLAVELSIDAGKEQGEWITELILAEKMRVLTDDSNPTIPSDLRKHYKSDVSKLNDATSSIIEIFTSQMNAMVVEKNRWEKSYNELADKKDEEIKNQKDKIKELVEIKKELEKKSSDLDANYNLARESAEACKKRAEDQEAWLKNRQDEIGALKKDLTEKNKLLDDLKNVESEKKRLEEDFKKMTKEYESLKITFKNETNSLKSNHESEISEQRKKHIDEIAALVSKHGDEIQALQKQHEENLKLQVKEIEIQCKETALEERKKLTEKFNDESREREKEIRTEIREDIEKMRNFYEKEFSEKLATLGVKSKTESVIDIPDHPTTNEKTRRPRKKKEEETK